MLERTRTLIKGAVIAAAAVGSLAVATGQASAAIVCNHEGDCWHTHQRWGYPGGGYAYHPDDWYFHRSWSGGPYRWHDYHPGRGYWRNGGWTPF
jgi:hypothetical protein